MWQALITGPGPRHGSTSGDGVHRGVGRPIPHALKEDVPHGDSRGGRGRAAGARRSVVAGGVAGGVGCAAASPVGLAVPPPVVGAVVGSSLQPASRLAASMPLISSIVM